jgi:hypothetical protein
MASVAANPYPLERNPLRLPSFSWRASITSMMAYDASININFTQNGVYF